jgi:DNA modification methylase
MPTPPNHFLNQILCGDAQDILKQLPDESIDCVVTSPPYWGLRDYGVKGQIGQEPTFQQYLCRLGGIFDEIKRVLKRTGTCWVVLGDTYSTQSGAMRKGCKYLEPKRSIAANQAKAFEQPKTDLPDKCLLEIPVRFAIQMINQGWILRNEIVWMKPNAMPESVKDRFTVDFEKLFFFVKSQRYYFQQQFEELKDRASLTRPLVSTASNKKRVYGDEFIAAFNPKTAEASRMRILRQGRNKRSVWAIATRPYRGNHFAVYPPQLIETPIKAGCPKGGVVLDPFIGSGTTARVAQKLGRKFIGIDLNSQYVQLAKRALRSSR